uniref:Uncharacterized protein n=1 Tax=Wuchereria bancrofti TaxID=6293 RepID=A0AAF5PNI7_WUCBA
MELMKNIANLPVALQQQQLVEQQLVAQKDVQLERQRQPDVKMSSHSHMDNVASVRHGHDAYQIE